MTKPTSPVFELAQHDRLRHEATELVGHVIAARRHDPQLVALLDAAVDYADQRHDTHVVIEPGVDDQRLQRRLRVALGRRNPLHERFEQIRDALACLGTDARGIRGVDAYDFLDLLADPVRVGRREVDLVDDGQDLDALLHRGITVGDALSLNAL